MKYLFKFIILSTLIATVVNAKNITDDFAASLAKYSYESKQDFAKKFKTYSNTGTSTNKISSATVSGVRYFIIEDKNKTIVAIRGTANMKNALTDVMASEEQFLNYKFVHVHHGFYSIAKQIYKTIKLNTKKPVVIVGHSLGGAVALLYGAMLSERDVKVSIFTFGMPPVANKAFLKKYNHLEHNRFHHVFDPVPTLSKPTIQVFQKQLQFKSLQALKGSIKNMIDTIQNIPDKFRHQGFSHTITNKLNISAQTLKESLFFKTCSLYFDYHKIDNYLQAVISNKIKKINKTKNQEIALSSSKHKSIPTPQITIIPSILKGTTPLEVEFYIDDSQNKSKLYYFSFAGQEMITEKIRNNKVRHLFTKDGKHDVKIALKDAKGEIKEFNFVVETREPTFEEYQEIVSKEFLEYKSKN